MVVAISGVAVMIPDTRSAELWVLPVHVSASFPSGTLDEVKKYYTTFVSGHVGDRPFCKTYTYALSGGITTPSLTAVSDLYQMQHSFVELLPTVSPSIQGPHKTTPPSNPGHDPTHHQIAYLALTSSLKAGLALA